MVEFLVVCFLIWWEKNPQSLKTTDFTASRTQVFVVTKITDLKIPKLPNGKQKIV